MTISKKIVIFCLFLLILTGCTYTFSTDNIPDKLIFIKYNNGAISLNKEIAIGTHSYDAINHILKNNNSGWKKSYDTYAPYMYFKSDNITINFQNDLVIVNYQEKSSKKWLQIAKEIPGCKQYLIEAMLSDGISIN